MKEIGIYNETEKDVPYLTTVKKVIKKAMEIENIVAELNIIIVDDSYIWKLNKDYRHIDRPTDVISFAFNDNGSLDGPINMLGEIYVSIDRMKEQAVEYGHSEKRELSFLCIHGLLHLLGYDHTLGEKEEKEMFDLQREILNEKGIID